MSQNFLPIQKEYLQKAWERSIRELEESLPARHENHCFYFQAFGEPCELRADYGRGELGEIESGPFLPDRYILISSYVRVPRPISSP